MTESKTVEPADDDQNPRSSRCSHAIVNREWTEVSDFGDIHNLYAAMDSAEWATQLIQKLPETFIPTGKTVKTGFVECPIYKYVRN